MRSRQETTGWRERLTTCCGWSEEGDYLTEGSDDERRTRVKSFFLSTAQRRGQESTYSTEKNCDLTLPDKLEEQKHDWANPDTSGTDGTAVSPYPGGAGDEHFTKSPGGGGYRRLTEGHGSDRSTSAPPKNRSNKRWTDDILEGFLQTTLVEGKGLVLTKLDSGGKRKKVGERILSYNPHTMDLIWTTTGLRRQAGGMKAKAIDNVLRDGKVVTIVYSVSAAEGGPRRRGSLSPLRRGSISPLRRGSLSPVSEGAAVGEHKVFEASQERDAHILQELLFLVQRKAKAAAAVVKVDTGADDAAGQNVETGVGIGTRLRGRLGRRRSIV